MNTLAKRVHNIAPDPVALTIDGETLELVPRSAEFFREEFRAEGVADGTAYRMVSDGADDPLVVARETADGWAVVGAVSAVDRA